MERLCAAPTSEEHWDVDAHREETSGEYTLAVLNIPQDSLDRTLSSEQNGTVLCNSLPASSLGLAILYAVWEVWLWTLTGALGLPGGCVRCWVLGQLVWLGRSWHCYRRPGQSWALFPWLVM